MFYTDEKGNRVSNAEKFAWRHSPDLLFTGDQGTYNTKMLWRRVTEVERSISTIVIAKKEETETSVYRKPLSARAYYLIRPDIT